MGVLALEFLTQQCGVQENESLVRSRGARMLVVWPPHLEGHPTLRIAASEQASLKELSGFAPPTPPLPFSPEPTPFGISTLLKLPLSRSSVIYSFIAKSSLPLPSLAYLTRLISPSPVKCLLTESPGHPSLSLSWLPFYVTDSSLSVSLAWGPPFFIYTHSLRIPAYNFKCHLYANGSQMPTSSLVLENSI